jgi:integrase
MVEDIDRVNKKIVVCHNVVFKSEGVDGVKQTKSKKSREVPLPGIVLESIDVVQAGFPGKFVIPNMAERKNPSDKSTFRRGFPRVLRAIGIDEAEQKRRNLVLHGLRHSYITLVQSIGINEFAAQYFAGHQDIKLTRHYTHPGDHINMEEAGDVINSAVKAVGSASRFQGSGS